MSVVVVRMGVVVQMEQFAVVLNAKKVLLARVMGNCVPMVSLVVVVAILVVVVIFVVVEAFLIVAVTCVAPRRRRLAMVPYLAVAPQLVTI